MRKGISETWFTIGGVVILFSFLLVWQIISITNVLPPTVFPSASVVIVSFFQQIFAGSIPSDLVSTLVRLFEGYLLAIIIGVIAGIAIGISTTMERTTDPLIQFLRPMPSIVLIPLAMLYFGIVDSIIILLTIYASIWPILINTIDGVKSIDPMILDTAQEFGVTGFAKFRKIIVPASSPFIFSGMRVSLGIAWIVAITAEMVSTAAKVGIGVSIFYDLNAGNLTGMYGAIIAVAIVAYVLNRLFLLIENRVIPWHGRATKVLPNE